MILFVSGLFLAAVTMFFVGLWLGRAMFKTDAEQVAIIVIERFKGIGCINPTPSEKQYGQMFDIVVEEVNNRGFDE